MRCPSGADQGSPCVVIIAPAKDAHALVVAKRLEALKAEAVLLDSAEFPARWNLSFETGPRGKRFRLRGKGLDLSETRLRGVWWRRPRRHLASSDVVEAHLRRFVSLEARAAFEGWLHSLGRRVVNPVAADHLASHKLLQLQLAQEAGLRIPQTLATNCPHEARRFSAASEVPTVYKAFTAASWDLFPTQRLTDDALVHLEAVSYAPVIFQEEIAKVADIRVTIIDGEVFAISIKCERDGAPIDWRVDPIRLHEAHALPGHVSTALVDLTRRLGLRFAACDLGLDVDGDYVFFELNPGGQWLFAEIMAGQEISWALARALLSGDRGSAPLQSDKRPAMPLSGGFAGHPPEHCSALEGEQQALPA